FLTGERHGYYADFGSAQALAKAMTEVFVHNGTYSSFRDRIWGRPVPVGMDGRRFVVTTENHDQVGNRGIGDRPAHTLDEDHLALGTALLLCGPYTPMLFMGQEWAASTPWQYFTDHQDPALAEAVQQGRQRELAEHGWQEIYPPGTQAPDPQDPHTRDVSVLRHDEAQHGRHRRIRDFYRRLLQLRAHQGQLRSGDRTSTHAAYCPYGSWFVLTRADIHVLLTRAPARERV